MLRKILTLAVTAVLAKKAWDQIRTLNAESSVDTTSKARPASTAEDVEGSALTAVPVLPESPMQYH